jgi:RNA 3'-terminal phosphate cyclase
MVTGKPFQMIHVRAKRPNPGLQAQHLLTNVATMRKFLPVGMRYTGAVGQPGAVEVSPVS